MHKAFDILVAGFGVLMLSPFIIIISLIIKIHDGGPVFYKAHRVGRNGILFHLYKFRTMVIEADKLGAGITHAKDTRITPFGKLLRRFKLDELPQVLNVLKGEMSLVGPRPEDPCYTKLYNENQKRILSVRPGITSPASLYFKDESHILTDQDWEEKYIHFIMPEKLAIDLKYFENNTFLSDLGIIMKTVIGIFRKK